PAPAPTPAAAEPEAPAPAAAAAALFLPALPSLASLASLSVVSSSSSPLLDESAVDGATMEGSALLCALVLTTFFRNSLFASCRSESSSRDASSYTHSAARGP